jgi:predicted nucleotidyltransferase
MLLEGLEMKSTGHENCPRKDGAFDIDRLSVLLKEQCPQVLFALLHGSAKDGRVKQAGDIDLALFIEGKPTLEIYEKASRCVEAVAGDVKCDIGILNNAEPVYRFEALTGRLLFFRNEEQYLQFFSLTCRQYESQVADYQRQQRYRLSSHYSKF